MKPNRTRLNYEELETLCRRMSFSDQAIERIMAAFEKPSRRTRSGSKNVSGRYPSLKNGVTAQYESHRVELPYIMMLEYDRDVVAYFDQPQPLKFRSTNAAGKAIAWLDTPDFLVVYRNHVAYVECKDAAELQKLADKWPDRYVREADGVWRCPPGEQAAAAMGFSYQLWSSAQIEWSVIENINYLEDYLNGDLDAIELDTEIQQLIQRVVDNEFGITLAGLHKRVSSNVPRTERKNERELGKVADAINVMVARREIYVDLTKYRLADREQTRAYPNEEVARAHRIITAAPSGFESLGIAPSGLSIEPGTVFSWQRRTWTIIDVNDTDVTVLSERGNGAEQGLQSLAIPLFEQLISEGMIEPVRQAHNADTASSIKPEGLELLSRCSPEGLEDAIERYKIIFPGGIAQMPGEVRNVRSTSSRRRDHNKRISRGKDPCATTITRWRTRYRKAESKYNCGFLGLIDGRKLVATRQQRLSEATTEFLESYIREHVESLTQAPYYAEYRAFAKKCEQQGIESCSYVTFRSYVNKRPLHERELKRQGPKGAYGLEPFYWHWRLDLTIPRHGNRPWMIGHIDHTEGDTELSCYRRGKRIPLGRIYFTFLVDAYSRRILAIYAAYHKPDSNSCMMVLRDCVRRWNRLPQTILVDAGKEFSSTYFETLLALYKVDKKHRPPAKPRFGSVIERLFGTTNTQFFWFLQGNTQIMRNVRQVTKKQQPKGRAIWTLPALFARLSQYCCEEYDQSYHSTLADTPRNVYRDGIEQHGSRSHLHIPYDDTFKLYSLPTTPKGTAKVQQMGLYVNSRYYWHPDMRLPNVFKTSVPVRYDPFEISGIHAFIRGSWVTCLAHDYHLLRGRTEAQARLIAERWKEQSRLLGGMRRKNNERLGEFLLALRNDEELLIQQWRDEEHKPILDVINGHRRDQDLLVTASQGAKSNASADAQAQSHGLKIADEDAYASGIITSANSPIAATPSTSFTFSAHPDFPDPASATTNSTGTGADPTSPMSPSVEVVRALSQRRGVTILEDY